MNQYNKPNNKTRGAAFRALKRGQDDADKAMSQHTGAHEKPRAERPNTISNASDKLKVTFLGGLLNVGEKNMAVIEYGNDALVLDCGNNLGVELPGINYEINDTAYLETIRHKIRGYVITHGHLDHMGGLRHIVPKFPAPIYGSRYTIGIIEKSFADDTVGSGGAESYKPELVTAQLDTHERFTIGCFTVEFIRVTHSLPDAAAICIETPVGRIIATGDFRLDPEPLDQMPTDTRRLQELGAKGVLLLLSESSYADIEGRVPTESTLQQSFYDLIDTAAGRIFVAAFSSNMNRTQMIINAAVAAGRKVALDGRGMLAYADIAVRQGILKVPKGTIIPITQATTVKDDKLLVMCTGGQGEPNAALQRMSTADHKYVALKAGDTVVISSSPIPGNESSYDAISNRLSAAGVRLYRHPTHELDGCGPLHVSGHARRDELREMIRMTNPKFFVPVHGGNLRRGYHAELAVQEGMPREHTLLPENGDSLYFSDSAVEVGGKVPHGSVLVDQNGSTVSGIVVKDRLLLGEQGIVTVVLTVDKRTGSLLASPDILSRGFIKMRGSDELVGELRAELKRATGQRFRRVDLDSFKSEIREFVTGYFYERTGRSPMVIPVVNVVGGASSSRPRSTRPERPAQQTAAAADTDQKRFQEMRTRLLG